MGVDVFMFDFRGHGNSGPGRLSFGQFESRDVSGALNYLRSRGVSEVGVIGWSLGATRRWIRRPSSPSCARLL